MAESKEDKKQDILEECIRETQDFFLKNKKEELYRHMMEMVEKPLIEMTLAKTNGNQIKAAKLLGINRNTLHAKVKKLGIEVTKFKEL